jgi:hypothetical protein
MIMSDNVITYSKSELTTPTVSNKDSSFYGISVRAWLAIFLVFTVCFNNIALVIAVLVEAVKSGDFTKVGTYATISEPLYTLVIGAVAYYFGQKR